MTKISDSTVSRLSHYYRVLEEVAAEGGKVISSHLLAEREGITSAQVRKDLSYFGSFGRRGLGYSVEHLRGQIRAILGLDRRWRVAVVGAGHIGSALLAYRGFAAQGFDVVAVFDADAARIGREEGGLVVRDVAQLSGADAIDIGVIATPLRAAQEVADALVAAGVRGILNFAPRKLRVPPEIWVRTVDMTTEFESLSFVLLAAQRHAPETGRRVSPRRGEAAALAAMVAATLLWGGTFVAIRDSVGALPPATLVCGRFGVAALIFVGVVALRRRPVAMRDAWAGAGAGALMLAGYFLQAEGLRTTSAGSSAFLTCAGTLLAAFFAWPLLRQRPGPVLLAGIVLALAGSGLLSLRGDLRLGRGELLTLLGAAFFALQVVALGRLAPNADPLVLTGAQAATVALVLAPFARGATAAFGALDAAGWMRFAYLALAGSTIAPLLQVLAQRRLPPGRIGLLFALEPVFALVFALTLGAERFEPRWWIGAGMILSAVVLVEWRAASSAPR